MPVTSRQRAQTALEHCQPDRVPIDLNPLLDFYTNLKEYLKLDFEETLRYSAFMEVEPDPRVLKALGVDFVSVKLGSPTGKKKEPRPDGLVQDEWGVLYRYVTQTGGGRYLECCHSPLADASIEDLESYPWPVADLPGRGEGAERQAKRLFEDTDMALVGRFGGSLFETAQFLIGFENWMTKLVTDPPFIGALLDKINTIILEMDRIGLQAAGRYLTIFKASGEDLGGQNGPLYSPRVFNTILLPRLQARWSQARAILDEINPQCKIMLHSCGSVRRDIPAMIAGGIQVLDPIQPRAAGMDSADLKRDFGEALTFHGGVDIQQVLPFGTPAEVEAEVKARLSALAQGGGYILCPSHFVQADTPPANIVAMCQAAQRWG